MLLCENDRNPAINMADSCHVGFCKFIPIYGHDAIDISCNKFRFIPWGLNALVLRMKKDESLYDIFFMTVIHFQHFAVAEYISDIKFANFLLF